MSLFFMRLILFCDLGSHPGIITRLHGKTLSLTQLKTKGNGRRIAYEIVADIDIGEPVNYNDEARINGPALHHQLPGQRGTEGRSVYLGGITKSLRQVVWADPVVNSR
jgi:hypothetical protein